MNLFRFIATPAVVFAASASLSAQGVTFPAPGTAAAAPAAAAAPVAAPKYTEDQLLETFGWFVGKRIGITELKFTPEQTAQIVKGLQAAAAGKDAPYKLEEIGPDMDKFMQAKQQVYMDELKKEGLAASVKFLTEVKAKPGVISLPSGLAYEVVQAGTGDYPKPTDTVKVHYTGTLIDGSVFDSSVQRNEPAEFPLDQVIAGWTEGLQKVNKGGKIKLYVPPQLAYGDDGRPGIPPASTLIFDVELLEIKAAAPAPAPAAAPAAK
ncbi:MAG TPA: FKBP-type peptidyl-prolyl cis-trans isomerase [Opitutaceae bacterium]|jgi:FKBP-type peptidyl-prolyl cis-trans isomerase|nr:FKBP-type peptidyl-prolyl cis-trans isomerase [Opitutaceae bacterium]HRE04367.1 FKBP-type peptidyl-prolyl cis-trans isomerase [Opitutaceae bacterium]